MRNATESGLFDSKLARLRVVELRVAMFRVVGDGDMTFRDEARCSSWYEDLELPVVDRVQP